MFVCVKKRIRFLDRLKQRKTKIETKRKSLGQPSVHAKSLQSCPTLCDPIDCSPPGSSVHGILQTRILEWVAMPSPGNIPDPGIEPMYFMSPTLAGGFFTASATWEATSHTVLELKCLKNLLLILFLSYSVVCGVH